MFGELARIRREEQAKRDKIEKDSDNYIKQLKKDTDDYLNKIDENHKVFKNNLNTLSEELNIALASGDNEKVKEIMNQMTKLV